MNNIRNKKTAAFVILIFLVLYGIYYFQPKSSYKLHQGLLPNHIQNVVEVFHAKTQDKDLFIFTSIDFPITDTPQKKPIYIHQYLGSGKWGQDLISGPRPLMYHARHFAYADFNNDKLNDIVIVGHGIDAAPYPGEQSIILMQQPDGTFKDETSIRFPDITAYTFNVAAADINNDGHIDLFFNNFGGFSHGHDSFFLINDGNGYFSLDKNRFPEHTKLTQYLTCMLADFNNDGYVDLMLGGGDGQNLPKDTVFINDGNGFFNQTLKLPSRIQDPSWASAYLHAIDFNQDGFLDVFIATHNHGWSHGNLQLLKNNNGQLTNHSIDLNKELNLENNFWIGSLTIADVNRDGFDDVAFVLRHHHLRTEPVKNSIVIANGDKGGFSKKKMQRINVDDFANNIFFYKNMPLIFTYNSTFYWADNFL